jgi:hypothetical protein
VVSLDIRIADSTRGPGIPTEQTPNVLLRDSKQRLLKHCNEKRGARGNGGFYALGKGRNPAGGQEIFLRSALGRYRGHDDLADALRKLRVREVKGVFCGQIIETTG